MTTETNSDTCDGSDIQGSIIALIVMVVFELVGIGVGLGGICLGLFFVVKVSACMLFLCRAQNGAPDWRWIGAGVVGSMCQ